MIVGRVCVDKLKLLRVGGISVLEQRGRNVVLGAMMESVLLDHAGAMPLFGGLLVGAVMALDLAPSPPDRREQVVSVLRRVRIYADLRRIPRAENFPIRRRVGSECVKIDSSSDSATGAH